MRRPIRKDSKERLFYWGAAGVVLVTVSILIGVAVMPREGELAADLCPPGGPTAHVVLLVDATDPFTFTQHKAISQLIMQMAEPAHTQQGTLLTVFVFGESVESSAQPLFERCNPGSGEGKSEWTHNLELWRKRFAREFQEPLRKKIEELQPNSPASKSPIMQMIQIAALNFQKRESAGERRLLVISDLLQNTAELSLYREVPEYKAFRERSEARRLRANLRGVVVKAHVLMNTPQIQNRRLLKFWEEYFSDMGAGLPQVNVLPG